MKNIGNALFYSVIEMQDFVLTQFWVKYGQTQPFC